MTKIFDSSDLRKIFDNSKASGSNSEPVSKPKSDSSSNPRRKIIEQDLKGDTSSRTSNAQIDQNPPTTSTQNQANRPSEKSKKKKKHKHRVKKGSQFFVDYPRSGTAVSAFVTNPKNIKFSTQDSEEQVLVLLRQHPVSQLRWMLIAVALLLLPTLFKYVDIFDFLPGNYQLAGLISWYLLVGGYILESFLKWFYNVYIITDERFLDLDFDSLLYKNISAAKIDTLQDVTAKSKGILAAFFDYGDVFLQTAAEKREFEFSNVPHPHKIEGILNQLILEEEQEKIEGRVR